MDRNKILKVVEKEIKKWDPVNLLKIGAPENEYDIEIEMISNRIDKTSEIGKIAVIIYEVLIEMFSEDTFNNKNKLEEKCYDVAKIIYKNLNFKY